MRLPACRDTRRAGTLLIAVAALAQSADAQGVPIVDGKSVIQHSLEIAQMSTLTGARELEAEKKRRIDDLHKDQLDALDATLALMRGILRSFSTAPNAQGATTSTS